MAAHDAPAVLHSKVRTYRRYKVGEQTIWCRRGAGTERGPTQLRGHIRSRGWMTLILESVRHSHTDKGGSRGGEAERRGRTPETITTQNSADTHPVMAYSMILCPARCY